MKLKNLFLIFVTISSFAEEYAVVSNTILDDISKNQIRAIFLKKLTHLNGIHLVPVNLASDSFIRKSFEKELLGMRKKRLKSYWSNQHYLGNRPPVIMKSQKSALVFVKNVQGAITYVKVKGLDDSVKVLYRWSDDEKE